MKTPTWAIVFGIILMLFGGCGLMKNSQAIMMPAVMETQEKMMKGISEGIKKSEKERKERERLEQENDRQDTSLTDDQSITPPEELGEEELPIDNEAFSEAMEESMSEVFTISDFNKKWTVRFGYIGILVCAIYLLSGAFLVTRKIFAIHFVYFALGLSILFSLVSMLVLTSDSGSGFFGKMSAFGNIFGMVLDLILLIVFVVLNKTDLTKKREESILDDWEKM